MHSIRNVQTLFALLIFCHRNEAIIFPNIDQSVTPLSLPLLQAFGPTLSSNDLSDFDAFHNKLNGISFPGSYTNTFVYPSVGPPANAITFSNDLPSYYHNGRILKQYLVMEDNYDDLNGLENYLSRFNPYVPQNINSNGAGGFFPQERNAPVPVQLGSGSLGYLRLANGAVYLGSGSLGYTNGPQKTVELNDIRSRQSPKASPLTFGEAP